MKYRLFNIISGCVFLILLLLGFWGILPVWIGFLVIPLYMILILIFSTNIRSNFFIDAYNHNPDIPGNTIALSFDDGPHPNTLKILEILKKHELKAVFFCIGENIERYPEIFKEIIAQGHIVGNHTYSHTRKIGFLSSKKIYKEIIRCNEVAEKTAGVRMNLFRPPFGIINPKTSRALGLTGHQVMGWTVRPYDAITSSQERVLQRITSKVGRGDVILLHDNLPKTPLILEQLLVQLKRKKFRFLRPDKLFNIDAYY